MSDRRSLTVASWNVRAAIGPGEPFPPSWWRRVTRDRLEAIAAFIVGLGADVVALQEVALGNVDGAPFDQPAELARLTDMDVAYAALHHYTLVEHDSGRAVGAVLWGNALLSRLPVVERAAHALPVPADDALVEPPGTRDPRPGFDGDHPLSGIRYADAGMGPREARCVLDCTVDAHGTPVRILSTHLAYVGREQRRAQAEAIVGVAAGSEPVVFAGDLNAAIDDPELEPLRGAFVDAFAATGTPPASPARESCGRMAIDQLFVRGLRPLECRVVRESGDRSDHWPVRAELALAG
ncbi:MAG TPA: endonuclease/exonuclease/phosphatase family protein [Candidatus Limnocylindrales bacterium]|nr:endonuclease/exonuclease/phosphatase family protein [Candidatus Limnocylindrales bacterium]